MTPDELLLATLEGIALQLEWIAEGKVSLREAMRGTTREPLADEQLEFVADVWREIAATVRRKKPEFVAMVRAAEAQGRSYRGGARR